MKEFDLFEKIWASVVVPTCTDFLSQYNLKNYVSWSKRIAKSCFYDEVNLFVKSYMVKDTKNIDRHKIAACMIKAILVSKPLRVSFIDKVHLFFGKKKFDDDVIYLINQYIAINVAVIILEGYIRSDDKKIIKHRIYFPEPFPDGEKDYIKDVCLDLYYTKAKKINTVAYSNILFLWEKYSCRRVQCRNLESMCRKFLIKDCGTNNEYLDKRIDDIRFLSE